MIYIRTILAIYIIFLLGSLGAKDSRFTGWLYHDLRIFVNYGEAESFTRLISWSSIFLFVASCFFCK
jgi:hypothetical protein